MYKHELGMLIGLHAGDALGTTLEFSPPRKRNDWLEDIVGGGPFQIAPGEGTDDTDLMIAVLASIRSRTEFSKEECLSRFLSWLETNPKDVGNTTRSNLLLQKRGLTPLISDEGQGNGSLMRCAPLALMALGTRDLSKVVQEQCALTHPHLHCLLADEILVTLLRAILAGGISKEVVFALAKELSLPNPKLREMMLGIRTKNWDEVSTSGFVFDTLTAALWAFYHSESFEDALTQIVNRGDDSDTVGAVTGALCGAFYGVDQIPGRWLTKLIEKDQILDLLVNLSPLTIGG